jgi:hypothetical protein
MTVNRARFWFTFTFIGRLNVVTGGGSQPACARSLIELVWPKARSNPPWHSYIGVN